MCQIKAVYLCTHKLSVSTTPPGITAVLHSIPCSCTLYYTRIFISYQRTLTVIVAYFSCREQYLDALFQDISCWILLTFFLLAKYSNLQPSNYYIFENEKFKMKSELLLNYNSRLRSGNRARLGAAGRHTAGSLPLMPGWRCSRPLLSCARRPFITCCSSAGPLAQHTFFCFIFKFTCVCLLRASLFKYNQLGVTTTPGLQPCV